MNYYVFIPLASFTGNLLTWTYIIAQRPSNPLGVAYLLFTGYLAVWSLSDFILWSSTEPRLFVPLLKIATSLGFLTNFSFLHVIYTLTRKQKDGTYYTAGVFVTLCAALNLATNVYVNGYATHSWGVSYLAGRLFLPMTGIHVALFIYATGVVYHAHQTTSRHPTNTRLPQVFSGSVAFAASMLLAQVVLPRIVQLNYPLHLPLIITILQSVFVFNVVAASHIPAAPPPFAVRQSKGDGDTVAFIPGHAASGQNGVERNGSSVTSETPLPSEEKLIKADMLDSIGLLAGGVAHDFNNILTAIIGNIALARMGAKHDGKILARLANAEKAALQAQHLTQQLLSIAKEGTPIRQPVSIDDLLRNCIDFSLRGSNVTCEYHLKERLWPVAIDQGQISQVINNLIINADQAMPDGGCINVYAHNVTIHTQRADRHLDLEPGKYVKISVHDNGIGIAADHISKIFDPYFTTKQTGNGLGLFTCYSIIKKHHGHLSVASQQGVGTTFTIYLAAAEQHAPQQPGKRTTHYPGEGNILIMEDDETIREVTGEMLGHLGYEVTFARDGTEAIALYSQGKYTDTPFEAVVLDLTVPGGMGGKQTIQKLLEIDPQTRAIVASGYSNDPIMAQYEYYGFCDRIVKPYQAEELHAVLHRVIKTRQAPPAPHHPYPSAPVSG